MKPADEKSVRELGIAIGQVNYSLNISFLNFALFGGMAKNPSAASVAAHATLAAMGDGLNQNERDLAVVCHDELCNRVRAGMSLSDAVASARFQEPGNSAFHALSESFLSKMEAAQ